MGEKFQVLIEVGHKATKLKEPVGLLTHKWNLFVRSGDESLHIDKLVQRVVFNLHETFTNSTRVCDTPPFCVKEQGYGEFELLIEIYFRTTKDNSKEANKYSLVYFLEFPHANSPSLNRVRSEKICFLNPTPEFRRILEESGAVAVVCSDAEQQQNHQLASNSITSSNKQHTLSTSQSTSSLSMLKNKMKSSTQLQQSDQPVVNGHARQSIGSSVQNAPSPPVAPAASLHSSFKSTSSLETLKSNDEKTMLNGNVMKKKLINNSNSNNRKSLIRNEIPKTASSPASTTTSTSENSVNKSTKLSSPSASSSPAVASSSNPGVKTTTSPSQSTIKSNSNSTSVTNNKTAGETKKESSQQQQLKSNKINLQDYKARLNVKSPLNANNNNSTTSPPKIYDQNITSTTNEQTMNGKTESKKIKTSGEPLISTTTIDNMPFNENEITSTNVAVANGSPSSATTTTAQNQQSMIMTPPPSNSSITNNVATNVVGAGSMASHSVSPSSSSIPKSETGKEWNDFDPVVAQMKLNSVYSPPASHDSLSTNGDNQITSTTLNASKTSPSSSKPIESTKRKLETTSTSHTTTTLDHAIIDTTSNKKNAQIQEEKKRKRDGGGGESSSRDTSRPIRPNHRKNSDEATNGGREAEEMSDSASSDGEIERQRQQHNDRRGGGSDRRRRSKSRKRSKNSRERKRHRHSRSRSRIRSRSRSSHSNRRRRRSDTTSTVNTTSTNGSKSKKDEEERRRRRRRRRSSHDASESRSSSNSSVNSNKSGDESGKKSRHHHHSHRHHHRHRRRRSSSSNNKSNRKRSQERKLSKDNVVQVVESVKPLSNDINGPASKTQRKENGKTQQAQQSSNGKIVVNKQSDVVSKSKPPPEQLTSILENEENNSDSIINKSRVNTTKPASRSMADKNNKTNNPNRTTTTTTPNDQTVSSSEKPLNEDRMLRLYEGIRLACSQRHVDVLTRVYRIVQPYSFTESSQFKFDLYALEPGLLVKLERILSPLILSSSKMSSSDNRINNHHLLATNNTTATVKSQIT